MTFIDATNVAPARGQRSGKNPMLEPSTQDRDLDAGPPLEGALVRVLIASIYNGPNHKKLPAAKVNDLIRVAGGAYLASLEESGLVTRDIQGYGLQPVAVSQEELDISEEDEQLMETNPLFFLVGEESYEALSGIGLSDKGSIRMLFMREGVVPFMRVVDAETTEAVLLWAGEMEEIIQQRITENVSSYDVANDLYTNLRLTEPQIGVLRDAHLLSKSELRAFLDNNGAAGLIRMRLIGVATTNKLIEWSGWIGNREADEE